MSEETNQEAAVESVVEPVAAPAPATTPAPESAATTPVGEAPKKDVKRDIFGVPAEQTEPTDPRLGRALQREGAFSLRVAIQADPRHE